MKTITFTHEGKKHIVNLAEAAELINMADSTFSQHWRACELMGRSEQASFDWILKRRVPRRKQQPVAKMRTNNASAQSDSVKAVRDERNYYANKDYWDFIILKKPLPIEGAR